MKRAIKIVLFCLAVSLPVLAGDFSFVSFDFPTCNDMAMSGLNIRAQVVGLCFDSAGTPHGFLLNLNDGSSKRFDIPGSVGTAAAAINNRGDIVGRWVDAAGIDHPYLLTKEGQLTTFQPTAPCVPSNLVPHTVAHGINDVGEIVGRCWDVDGHEHGFLRRLDGTFMILDFPDSASSDAWTISNSGVIVGDYSDSEFFVHGFILTAAGFKTIDFPGAPDSALRDINENGDITGIYDSLPDFRLHAFLLRDGVFTSIDFPGADQTDGLEINNRGLMVGDYVDSSGLSHGFLVVERK